MKLLWFQLRQIIAQSSRNQILIGDTEADNQDTRRLIVPIGISANVRE